jgi:hypothetical protein
MDTVRDILDAIRTLPRPERVRLAQELSKELGAEAEDRSRSGEAAAAEFDAWLEKLLSRVPSSPPLLPEAFDRGSIYE